MPLMTFPTLGEAQQAQEAIEAPLIVFAYSATEATAEEEATNCGLSTLTAARYGAKVLSSDLLLSSVKGRNQQRRALEAVLGHGLLSRVIPVHEVQEGTAAYQQLVEAVPQFTAVPRVHILPSSRSRNAFPIVLCGDDFTSFRLLQSLQYMLRLPLGGAAVPSSLPPSTRELPEHHSAKYLMQQLQEQVEVIDSQLSASATPASIPSRPSSSPAGAPTCAAVPKKTPPPSAIAEKKVAKEPEVKKRPASSGLSDTAPVPQRQKPEVINLRCSLPVGVPITVGNLRPQTSTIASDVRPVVRTALGHDNFEFVKVSTPPQRLDRTTQETVPLQDIKIVTSSSLRVVIVQSDLSSAPGASTAETTRKPTGVMNGLMGFLRRNPGPTTPPPVDAASARLRHSESNIRTLQDVLAAQSSSRPVQPTAPFNTSPAESGRNGGDTPDISTVMQNLKRMIALKNAGASDGEDPVSREDDDDDAPPETRAKPFAGKGRRLRDSQEEKPPNEQ